MRLRIVADQADAEGVGGLEQQLAAGEQAVAVVDVGAVVDIVVEAVALDADALEPEGERVGQRAGDAGATRRKS